MTRKSAGRRAPVAIDPKCIAEPVCNVLEFKDGKLISEREYMDMMHLMQQIGAAPKP